MKLNQFFSRPQTDYLTDVLNKMDQTIQNGIKQNNLSLEQMDDKISKLEKSVLEVEEQNAQLSAFQLAVIKIQIAANILMIAAWGLYEISK